MRRLLLTLSVFLALAAPAHASWSWPVRGDVITQYRNGDDPYAAGQHRGIDIAAPVGTPVVAAAGGDVVFAGTAGSSGLTVSVQTGDGFDTSYLHLSALAVRAGAHVSAGEWLGAVGTSGTRSAVQPHLHFGVRESGTRHAYLDPLSMLPPAGAPPTSEAPRPAPAPAPAPLAPSPAPVPRPAPTPGRRPMPAPAPRSLPAPRRAPAPAPAPRSVPAPLPAPLDARRQAPAPAHERAPSSAGAPSTATERAPAETLASAAPSPKHSTHRFTSTHPPPSHRAHASPPSSGRDIGWALACAGLLLAAAILTLTGDRPKTSARTRSRLAGALRPLLGRR